MHDAPLRFPALEGKTLIGEPREFPRDFAGAKNIVVLGFAREQVDDVLSWVPLVRSSVEGRTDVRAFLVVVLSNGMKMMRGMIEPAIRAAVAEPEARASTVIAFCDINELKAKLAIVTEKELAVFLVASDGAVDWRASGAFDAAKGGALEGAITA